jgi:hypothetical protein
MPLTTLQANVVIQWVQSRSNAPFAPTRQGADGVEYNLADLNEIFDYVYANQLVIPEGEFAVLDLMNLVDLVCTPFGFTSLLFLFVMTQNAPIDVITADVNGLQIFGLPIACSGGVVQRRLEVRPNGCGFSGLDPAGVGLTVDANNRFLELENLLTGGPSTVTVVLAGAGVQGSGGGTVEFTDHPV